jgi:hypothetical protein
MHLPGKLPDVLALPERVIERLASLHLLQACPQRPLFYAQVRIP